MKSEELAKELAGKGINLDSLMILYVGTEQLLGEQLGVYGYGEMTLRNPKRILRLQQVAEGGIVISLMIGDLDFVTGTGLVHVRSTIFYTVNEQSEETKVAVYRSYLDYFERKTVNKAEDAGLVLPNAGRSPFRKG